MSPDQIQELISEFGPVRWVSMIDGVPGRGWFLLEISPLPEPSDRSLVLADICKNGVVNVHRGKIFHSRECKFNGHNLPANIKDSLASLKSETFKIAIYPGEPHLLLGQPIAIAIDPPICYSDYPDHPHLNMGRHDLVAGRSFYIPDSLCYTDNPDALGTDEVERLLLAFDQISIWLLRHQVWVATRNKRKPGAWIGPHKCTLQPEDYAIHLNPLGCCRCGKKRYSDCHYKSDFAALKEKHPKVGEHIAFHNNAYTWWTKNIKDPHNTSMKLLQILLRGS